MATEVHDRTHRDDSVTEVLTTQLLTEELLGAALSALRKKGDSRYYRSAMTIKNIARTRPASVSELELFSGVSRRSLSRWMQEAGLPSLKHWIRSFRLARVVADLNGERSVLSVREAAKLHDYPDPFTLSNQMFRTFGIRPTEARSWTVMQVFEKWLAENVG